MAHDDDEAGPEYSRPRKRTPVRGAQLSSDRAGAIPRPPPHDDFEPAPLPTPPPGPRPPLRPQTAPVFARAVSVPPEAVPEPVEEDISQVVRQIIAIKSEEERQRAWVERRARLTMSPPGDPYRSPPPKQEGKPDPPRVHPLVPLMVGLSVSALLAALIWWADTRQDLEWSKNRLDRAEKKMETLDSQVRALELELARRAPRSP